MAPPNLVPALQLSFRAALSAAVACVIAQVLGLQYPLYAMIGAVIVIDLTAAETRALSARRLAGTVLGALVGASLSVVLPQGTWVIGVSIFTAMFLSHVLRLEGAAKVTGYVCGIIVLEHRDHPWSYALDRLLETVLGIAVATLVSMVPKLIRTGPAATADE